MIHALARGDGYSNAGWSQDGLYGAYDCLIVFHRCCHGPSCSPIVSHRVSLVKPHLFLLSLEKDANTSRAGTSQRRSEQVWLKLGDKRAKVLRKMNLEDWRTELTFSSLPKARCCPEARRHYNALGLESRVRGLSWLTHERAWGISMTHFSSLSDNIFYYTKLF